MRKVFTLHWLFSGFVILRSSTLTFCVPPSLIPPQVPKTFHGRPVASSAAGDFPSTLDSIIRADGRAKKAQWTIKEVGGAWVLGAGDWFLGYYYYHTTHMEPHTAY